MAGKVIKKALRVLLYVSVVLIVLPVGAYFSLQSPRAQTWITKQIAGHFSEKWNTVVKITGVDIEFFTKVVLEGVYVEDQRKDTLLYAENLKLDIGTFDRDNQTVFISDVVLKKATFKIKGYKNDSVLNFQFIIDEFTSKNAPSSDSANWHIGIGGIALDNIRFAYEIEKDTSIVKGINFSNLLAANVNGNISDLSFDADTIRCSIKKFSLQEKSGFVLKELAVKTSISPVLLRLENLKIITNNSQISTDISFAYSTYSDFNHFIDSVKMKSQFRNSAIEMADIAYFAPQLYGIKKKVFLKGNINGKVSDLKGREIQLVIKNETMFSGNIDMTGLPDINQTFMSFDAKELVTSKNGIENIPLPPFNEKHSISLPPNIALFGAIRFKGNFTGFYNDFVAYGKFNTALGQISTDISLKEDTSGKDVSYRGKFACKDFNLGRFFESEAYVGKITLNAIVEGKGLKKDNANVSMEGDVNDLELKGYHYKNIKLKGEFAKNIFDGLLTVDDENLQLDFNGNMDFSKSPTHVNFTSTILKAELSKLNILKSDTSIGITGAITINAVGNNIDDVIGELRLNDVVYTKAEKVFEFKDIYISIEELAGVKTMQLNSHIADMTVHGKIVPRTVAASLTVFFEKYIPSVFPDKKTSEGKIMSADFIYSLHIKQPDVVTRAFFPSLVIAPASSLSGKYNSATNDFVLDADVPFISMNKYKFNNCIVNSSSKDNTLSVSLFCKRVALADSVWIDSLSVVSTLARDSLQFKLNWHNNTVVKYEGDIPGYIVFSKTPKARLKFFPSVITIADSSWTLNSDNEVVLDSNFISVKNIDFICGNQRIQLGGTISEVKEEQMTLSLSSFSLANFNSFLQSKGVVLYGTISGNTSIKDVYDKPIFESSISVQGLKMNKEFIGQGSIVSVYDSQKQVLEFNGSFKKDAGDNLKFSGNYYPLQKENSLGAEIELHDFNLGFFNPFLKGFVENLKGFANASLKINGTPENPLVNGTVKMNTENVHVNYLGTNYHFQGDIIVKPNSFDCSNIKIYDVNQNLATVTNGNIFHNNFRQFQLDVDLNATKFLFLNTREKDNPDYYGKIFATGVVSIFGFLDNINISADVKTDRAKNFLGKNEYTHLFIPLSGSEEIGESGFISFVKKDTAADIKPLKYQVNTTGITLNLNVEATTDAEVQLIFDEKVGDVLKASGEGNIEIIINKFGDFKMFGDYIVDEGDYLFTLKNIVNKRFRLKRGGSVTWSGNPANAEINMSAIYELRTFLTPLFREYERTEAIKKRYPVDCVMHLHGKLLEPDIDFDIQLPTVDDFTRQQAYDKFKNSENEMNRQVFSLLFTNSFTPPDEQISEATGVGTVTSTEVLSNQLSNWLSQISNEFDVGIHYSPGDEVNRDEVEVALSTQLFNDKVSIDGSVANSTNTTSQNTSNIVGDINVDYKLTEDGKFRAKAYNRANEGDVLNTQKGPYTQGVGLLYKEEFETIGELYRRFLGITRKKKEKLNQ